MESALEKLTTIMEKVERNTSPKSSFYILVSKKNAKIRTQFNPLIELDASKKYEMCLLNLETYFSFPNISATNNHFRYTPDTDRISAETRDHEWFDVFIPEGCYEITDVNDYLQRIMKERGHYNDADAQPNISIEPNSNTLKSVLTIAPNYKVDFTSDNSIRTVLGFDRRTYSEGYNESEQIVNIMNVTSLRVMSDIIGASYTNGSTTNVIYSFFPNVGPGYKIIEVPTNLVYLPVTLSTISSMETKLTDQNGKLVNLRGEELSIRFHIREV
jgi:hypothetical protein